VTTSFKKILKKAGLADMTFHAATRHTAATLLFGKGTHPKLVQELLGHATISTTIKKYKTTSAAVSCTANRQRHATARVD
jgi:integrase